MEQRVHCQQEFMEETNSRRAEEQKSQKMKKKVWRETKKRTTAAPETKNELNNAGFT